VTRFLDCARSVCVRDFCEERGSPALLRRHPFVPRRASSLRHSRVVPRLFLLDFILVCSGEGRKEKRKLKMTKEKEKKYLCDFSLLALLCACRTSCVFSRPPSRFGVQTRVLCKSKSFSLSANAKQPTQKNTRIKQNTKPTFHLFHAHCVSTRR